VKILLIEDDIVDVMTVKRAAEELNLQQDIVHVSNGQEALDYLADNENDSPDIILLDINMSVMNGLEFLKVRQKIASMMLIPVIVLTTSNEEADRSKCYGLNISGYFTKSLDFMEFKKVYNTINNYWTMCEFPN